MNQPQRRPSAAGAPEEKLRVALQHIQAGRPAAAEPLLEAMLAADPRQPDALHLLGLVAHEAGRHARALDLVSQALAVSAANPLYWNTHGSVQRALGQRAAAENSFRRAADLAADFFLAHNNLGLALHAQGKLAEAEASFRRALELAPAYAPAEANLGAVLLDAGRPADAAAAFRRALGRGISDRATRIRLARALKRAGRYDEAAEALGKVLAVNPGDREARDLLYECRFFACEWSTFAEFVADYRQRIAAGVPNFAYEGIVPGAVPGVTRAEILALSRAAAARYVERAAPAPARSFARAPKAKLRLGYLSSDFREHPVARLAAELFELHDRARFEVFAYSIGPDDGSPLRARLLGAFDRFTDFSATTIAAAADAIAADGVDILVDLTGFTQAVAPQIAALRPAPVQASFLGYSGTMGADFIDYIVTDRFVVPPEHARDYAEAPAYLPDCYLPADRKRPLAPAPARSECGLPAEGFVFCCLNAAWRITPALFDVWMDLLRAVPGSVLWLGDGDPIATRNLRAAADAHGLAQRLVFAERVDYARHLARLGAADLFLDTVPYNARALAGEALWAGLPVLTCVGDSFAARVAGSALNAAGLPELITGSLDEYRALALRLARDPAVLCGLRERLAAARLTAPLFDSAHFTRSLEALYWRMWERYLAGEKPAMLDV